MVDIMDLRMWALELIYEPSMLMCDAITDAQQIVDFVLTGCAAGPLSADELDALDFGR